jgi:hypothetical protein
MDSKPTFRPEALHDLSEEQEINPIEAKAEWLPNRERIDQILKEQEVQMSLPKLYYSIQDPELQAMLPHEARFEDDLIEKYEVFALADNTVRIRIYPKETDPFWVSIDKEGVKGSPELLSIFITVTTQPAGQIQQYAQGSVRAVMGTNESPIPDASVSFRVTEDLGVRRAA